MTPNTQQPRPRRAPTARRLAAGAALAMATMWLSACGGGGGSDAAPTAPAGDVGTVPASALTSPDALVRYAAALAVDDTGQPLPLDGLTLPTSETAAPLAL